MAESVRALSDGLATIVEEAGPAVVRVEARRHMPASGIVWSADGIIVTSHHVLERDSNIGIGLADGQTLEANLVGRDHTTDLAVLRVPAGGLAPAAWAEPDQLRVGQLVLALGRPGRTVQAALGILTALGGNWRTPTGGQIDRYLQPDVVMYPGFSGGPLVNADGQLVGLNSSALLRNTAVSIPTPTVRQVVQTLLTHGRVKRGYLGVGGQTVRLPEPLAQQLNQETGLLLVSVEPGSPAQVAGLLLGDTIVALADQPVRHSDELMIQLSGAHIGSSQLVRFVRAGQLQELQVAIGERP